MAVAPTRRDVDRQRRLDQSRGAHLGLLAPRVRAVADASQAISQREEGAAPALRQSLVDLAAVAEALADDLPIPTV